MSKDVFAFIFGAVDWIQTASHPDAVEPSIYAVDGNPGRRAYTSSTVTTTGDLHYAFPLGVATSVVNSPVTFSLHYRSDATEQTIAQLNENWHFDLVDKVVLTMTGSVISNLRWITGSGDVHDYPGASGTPTSEYWYVLPGKAYSQFRYYDVSGTWILERYTPSGHVMRYERVGASDVFRPKRYFDPFDNVTTYTYATDGSLQKITDPRGLEISFSWTSTTCSITYAYPGMSLSALDRSFTFDASSKKVTEIRYPQTEYVKFANGTDKLLDIGNVQTDSKLLTFSYPSGSLLLTGLSESRGTTGGMARTLWTIEYANQGGRDRVVTATDVYGMTQHWTNRAFDANNKIQSYRWTEGYATGQAAGTTHDYTLDDQARILTETVTPGASGKPRTAASDSPAEPLSLLWTYQYGSCACRKPTKITTPTGAEFNLTWDATLNKITSLSKLNPAGTGTVAQTWTWRSFLEQGLPATYVPPSGGATLTYTYDLINRSDGLAGKKIDFYKVETSTITHPDTSTLTLETEVTLDTLGRPSTWKDVGDATFYASYYTTGQTGDGFVKLIRRDANGSTVWTETGYEFTNLGWLTRQTVGSGSTMMDVAYTVDAVGRTKSVSSSPGTSKPASVRETYRDRYGNVAVERKKNLNSQGQAQKFDDGTGNGRTWVRNEWHYDYDKLVESYLDRRSLTDGEDFTNIDTGTNPWMVKYSYGYRTDDGTLQTVTLPNGSTNEFVVDGYGTLYKAIADVGGANLELGRAYFDNDLMLQEVRKKLGSSTFAAWSVARNHNGKGYPYKTQDPTGVITTVAYDVLGRVTLSDMRNGTDPIKRKSEFEYDQIGRLTRQMAYLLNGSGTGSIVDDTKFVYTNRSQILRVEGELGRKSFRVYDSVGRLTTVRDNRSATTSECDEVVLEYMVGRDLVSKVTSRVWEDVSGAGVRKDYVTEYGRDWFGRVTTIAQKGLNGSQSAITRTFEYDTLGNLTSFLDPNSRPRTAVFDADGRWIESVLKVSTGQNAARIRMFTEYVDKVSGSKLTSFTRKDGNNFTTRQEYDALYRLARVERPGFATGSAHRTLLSYHADSGRLTTLQDGNDSIVTQSFDSAGRLLERSVAPGAGVSVLATKEKFEYDTIGVLKRMETDQQTGGSVFLGAVDLTTDTLNRLTKESFTYWGIDATRPVEITSGYTFADGTTTSDDPSFRRSLSHGSTGALAWGGSNLGVETTPDAIGRLDKVRVTPDGGSAFDLATYRWAGSQPVQRVLTYGAAGPGGPAHTQTTTFGYDAYRRLASIADKRDGQSNPYSAFAFEWDPAGNLLKEIYAKKQGGAGDRFNYDGFDRVIGAKLGAADMTTAYGTVTCAKEIVYNLDPGNSRTSVVETINGGGTTTTSYGIYNDNYRYQSVGTVSPQYDNEGNLYYDGRYYYVYDFKNRLSEIWVATQGTQAMTTQQRLSAAKQKNAPRIPVAKQVLLDTRKKVLDRFNGGLEHPIKKHKELQSQGLLDAQGTTQNSETFTLSLAVIYGYDPMNRRILRIIPGVLDHRYAYDRWREVSEITPVVANDGIYSPLVLKDFVWGSRIDELLSYRRQVGLRTWEAFYATQGKLDNVVALHKEDGTLVETVEYDPYGKASVFVGSSTTPQDASSVDNPYLFQGRRLDEETGFMYFRNRYLHTGWGRFITNDPIGNWGDAANLGNGVGFVGNKPGFGSDPSGLLSLYDTGGSAASDSGGGGGGGGGWTCGTPNIPGAGDAGGPGGGPEAGTPQCTQDPQQDPQRRQGPESRPSSGGSASNPATQPTSKPGSEPAPSRPKTGGRLTIKVESGEWDVRQLGRIEVGHVFIEYTDPDGKVLSFGLYPIDEDAAFENPLRAVPGDLRDDDDHDWDTKRSIELTVEQGAKVMHSYKRYQELNKKRRLKYCALGGPGGGGPWSCVGFAVQFWRDVTDESEFAEGVISPPDLAKLIKSK